MGKPKNEESPRAGHNGVDGNQLRSFIERIERLEEQKKAIGDDVKDIYADAKNLGFHTKTMRKVIAARKLDADKRREEQELLDVYMHALGMLADTPLGQAAMERARA